MVINVCIVVYDNILNIFFLVYKIMPLYKKPNIKMIPKTKPQSKYI